MGLVDMILALFYDLFAIILYLSRVLLLALSGVKYIDKAKNKLLILALCTTLGIDKASIRHDRSY